MENHIEAFKNTLSNWNCYLLREDKIQKFIDENQLIFFFEKDGEIYGSSEDGRMAFATMNDKDESKTIKKEIRVLAINLLKSLKDEKSESMFGYKQMKNIKILDRDEVEKTLHKKLK